MGWSCRADASRTMDKVTAACVKQTDMQNTFEVGGSKYFYDISRTEHNDGAITGTVFKFLPDGEHCRKSGSFRIEGDGTFSRGPAWMKQAASAPDRNPAQVAVFKRRLG